MNIMQDRIRGSLIGGAIGDALGYPVEFISNIKAIQSHYGERGITRLDTHLHWLSANEQSVLILGIFLFYYFAKIAISI